MASRSATARQPLKWTQAQAPREARARPGRRRPAIAQAARYIARLLLRAEVRGGWDDPTSGEFSRGLGIDNEKAFVTSVNLLHMGQLPGRGVVGHLLRRRGSPLSDHDIRSALAALKGTELEQQILAEAHAAAAVRAEQVRASSGLDQLPADIAPMP
jgi:hypothetical protein